MFQLKGHAGKDALDRWMAWACRCRIPPFVKLQQAIRRHRAEINAALDSDLSNALIESTNTKIRLLTRIAFGFKNPRRPHRPRHARPRRPPTRPPRPNLTHGQSGEPVFRAICVLRPRRLLSAMYQMWTNSLKGPLCQR